MCLKQGKHLSVSEHASHSHAAEVELVADVQRQAAPEAAHDHEHAASTEMHSFIGVALVLGFVFMLLVDQLGGGHSHHHSSASGKAGHYTASHKHHYIRVVYSSPF